MRTEKRKSQPAGRDFGHPEGEGYTRSAGVDAAADGTRLDRLDALRGLALVWMAAFHFCFDLANERLISANFYSDTLWTTQRTCILSLFLLCAGAGQAVATDQGQSWSRFWRRWAQIVACAGLVSAGSFVMFSNSWISFGVLHGMAVMLVVARLTARWNAWLWPLGLLAMLLPRFVAYPVFDTRLMNWVGLVTHKPITEDFVPVLPWLGLMWWGLAATRWTLTHRRHWLSSRGPKRQFDQSAVNNVADAAVKPTPRQNSAWHALRSQRSAGWRWLTTLGRWSLTFYMVHQPLLIGGLMTWMQLSGRHAP
jgi:uncharacterized membrane protein